MWHLQSESNLKHGWNHFVLGLWRMQLRQNVNAVECLGRDQDSQACTICMCMCGRVTSCFTSCRWIDHWRAKSQKWYHEMRGRISQLCFQCIFHRLLKGMKESKCLTNAAVFWCKTHLSVKGPHVSRHQHYCVFIFIYFFFKDLNPYQLTRRKIKLLEIRKS